MVLMINDGPRSKRRADRRIRDRSLFARHDARVFESSECPARRSARFNDIGNRSPIMKTDIIKTPGPDHPIEIVRTADRVVIRFADHIIADTANALVMHEAGYNPVQYIPLEDIDPEFLEKTSHQTYCPYKGQCSYFSLIHDNMESRNAVWIYEAPYPAVAEIRGHVAFYQDRPELTVTIQVSGNKSSCS